MVNELFYHTDYTDSNSTLTNEGGSSLDLSSPSQSATDSGPIIRTFPPLAGLECTTTPSPSSPSADELEVLRSQGAIPKR